jgi:hypothetical protein
MINSKNNPRTIADKNVVNKQQDDSFVSDEEVAPEVDIMPNP